MLNHSSKDMAAWSVTQRAFGNVMPANEMFTAPRDLDTSSRKRAVRKGKRL